MHKHLEKYGIPVPNYALVNREYPYQELDHFIEQEDFVEIHGKRFLKPFVEKPANGNVSIFIKSISFSTLIFASLSWISSNGTGVVVCWFCCMPEEAWEWTKNYIFSLFITIHIMRLLFAYNKFSYRVIYHVIPLFYVFIQGLSVGLQFISLLIIHILWGYIHLKWLVIYLYATDFVCFCF